MGDSNGGRNWRGDRSLCLLGLIIGNSIIMPVWEVKQIWLIDQLTRFVRIKLYGNITRHFAYSG